MTKRFLCKGKRIENGEWVTGQILIFQSQYYIFREFGDGVKLAKICPDTLCQCTDLCDEKGKFMFEGDVCAYSYFNHERIGKIRYNPEACAIEMLTYAYAGSINTYLLCHCDDIKVIGNIYDNPELLKGGKNK